MITPDEFKVMNSALDALEEKVSGGNPNHDERGRFAGVSSRAAAGGGSLKVTVEHHTMQMHSTTAKVAKEHAASKGYTGPMIHVSTARTDAFMVSRSMFHVAKSR